MKNYQITWKHSQINTKGEEQNQIPKQNAFVIAANSEDHAKEKFLDSYPALYVHDVREV